MKKMNQWIAGFLWLALFALWTAAVGFLDVRPIGPMGSSVGLAAVNGFVQEIIGVHFALYTLTDWLSLVPAAFCIGFAALGLLQWIRRKTLSKVDGDLLVLGGFYAVMLALYLLFEAVAVNFRPVLIEGRLEASYPSSTTLLVLCVMTTAAMQLRGRIRNEPCRKLVCTAIRLFTVFMIVGRLISGVHWITDILGGIFLSAGLIALYEAAVEKASDSLCHHR